MFLAGDWSKWRRLLRGSSDIVETPQQSEEAKGRPRKAKPFAEINSGVIKIGRNMYITSLEKPTKIPTILYGHPLYLYYTQKPKRNNYQLTLVKL